MKPPNVPVHKKEEEETEEKRSEQDIKWTHYSSKNMQEQWADVLIIPTRVKDLIQQIPGRNCVENVFTKDAQLGLRRMGSSEWGDEGVNVEKGDLDSGLF